MPLATALLLAEGLGGHGEAHEIRVWAFAAAVFAVAVGALVVLWRRASRRVELERAERVLEQEYEALERRDDPSNK